MTNSRKSNKNVTPIDKVSTESNETVVINHKQNEHNMDGKRSNTVLQKNQHIDVNLESSMEKLKVSELICDKCQPVFAKKVDFDRHVENKHSI